MKITYWSDYACPYCYIAETRFERVLREISKDIQVRFRCFELDPTASADGTLSMQESLMKKYNLTEEKALKHITKMTALAVEDGLDFRYSDARPTNTFDALRLTKFAQAKGKPEIVQKLFEAYFSKGLLISDHSVLQTIGCSCGLDGDEVLHMLESTDFADDVRHDEYEAASLGIHAVPFFLIDRQYSIPGAVPPEMMKQALETLIRSEGNGLSAGRQCGPNGCFL